MDLSTDKGGPGSTFHFIIDLGVSEKQTTEYEYDKFNLYGTRILAVDDNSTNLSIIKNILEKWKAEVDTASNGKEAFNKIVTAEKRNKPFDILLVDAHMPEMDGFELTKELKKSGKDNLSVMMLSSSDMRSHKDKLNEAGISYYLQKPLRGSEIKNVLINLLSDRKKKGIGVKSREHKIEAVKQSSQSEGGLRILLAEDNPINRKLATSLLEKRGWSVTSAENGRECVDLFKKHSFNIVLMDVQMPVMDGIEATKEIRKIDAERGVYTPVIAMTAHAMKGDRERFLAEGMDDYISKPMKSEQLYNIIEKYKNGMSWQSSSEGDVPFTDMAEIMDAVDGDKELVKELVNDFLEICPKQLEELIAAVHKSDPVQVERKAHSFKGSVGNFGVKSVQELAYELEKMGREEKLDNADSVLAKLQKEMKKIESYLSSDEWEKNL